MRHSWTGHLVAWCVLLGGFVALAGCDAGEVNAVKQSYLDFDTACARHDGKAAVALLSQGTFPFYDRLVAMARTAKPEEIQRLTTVEQYTVLGIRHELTKDELRNADGRYYLETSISKGYWDTGGDADPDDLMTGYKVRKDVATAIGTDGYGKKTSHRYYFIKENNQWKQDLSRGREAQSIWIEQYADEMRITVDRAILEVIESDTDREVPKTIWNPPF